ncbi:hypothetical protein DPEC_G00087470 [Dallia pectoralis]|uniref:Uncharacterized protein n=1 Tax=Dallia pectoralis TaxID=75939 RepID=A0ACC2H073_DALPE|nr:hypothetical protein DPEC_G00087470 [Dallia pectoralis]
MANEALTLGRPRYKLELPGPLLGSSPSHRSPPSRYFADFESPPPHVFHRGTEPGGVYRSFSAAFVSVLPFDSYHDSHLSLSFVLSFTFSVSPFSLWLS